jgi:predicted nucleic acid-binding protein
MAIPLLLMMSLKEGGAILSGNLIHDVQTAVIMLEHGIRTIGTRAADFQRFDFLKVIDALSKS